MGASGIAPSFAAAFGGKIIKRMEAAALFSLFVILGAVTMGHNVSLTLGKNLLPKEIMTYDTALIIIFSASMSLFLSNILKIPQSTSQVTVGAVTGAGIYFGNLYWKTLLVKIIPVWIILPLASYLVTLWLYRKIYPPKNDRLHLYEKIFLHEKKIKIVAVAVSCYVAFAIGSNNVANAVGPIFGAGIIGVSQGLSLVSPLFGLGAYIMGKGPLETAGRDIVPLGIFSCTVVSLVTATLLLVASSVGIPQSLVQLNMCSIFAVSSLKNAHSPAWSSRTTKKTFFIWAVAPVISIGISYLTLYLKDRIF